MLEGSLQRNLSRRKGVNISSFPIADETVKLSGTYHGIRKATSLRDQPVRSEDHREDLQGSSEGSQLTGETKDDAEARNDFWSLEGDFIYRHHVEPRVQLYVPKEDTFPAPLKYIDVTRTTYTNPDVWQESRIDDCWNVEVDRKIVRLMDRIYEVHSIERKPPKRIYVVRAAAYKDSSNNQT